MSSVISLDFSFAVGDYIPLAGDRFLSRRSLKGGGKKKRSKRKKKKNKKERLEEKLKSISPKGPRTEIAISDRDVGKSGLFGPIGPFIRR